MKLKLKYILSNLCLLILVFSFFPHSLFAQIEFDTSKKIIYEIGPRGNAKVTQEVGLTNNFSHIYPREYQMQLSTDNLENITAQDPEGSIISDIQKKDGKTIVFLEFNYQSVGKDSQLDFYINYEIPNFATKRGQIWEMVIPRLTNTEQIDHLDLELVVPAKFGSLSYSSVKPISHHKLDNDQIIKYSRGQIIDNTILLAFGEFQIFNFDLDFSLANNSNQPLIKSIPIPPDTSYQTIILTDINPKPIRIEADEDHNWLALYQLDPREVIEIKVKGQAKIFSKPENINYTNLYQGKDFSTYLKDDLYWEVNSPIIQDLANYFSTPKQIYDFILDNLEYRYEDIKTTERLGAVGAYQRGAGVCTEFSDLFVAIARATNIPARELQGFAFTEDKELFTLAAENDVLHSWVEYWDANNQVWAPADPTWGKTTEGIDFIRQFDLGHFVFVKHGHSSTDPKPPGFYKIPGQREKTINVEFGESLATVPAINFKPDLIEDNGELKLKIKNNRMAPVYQTEVDLIGWRDKNGEEFVLDILPPLGEEAIIVARPGFWQKLFSDPMYEVSINQQNYHLGYPGKRLNLIDFFVSLWPL